MPANGEATVWVGSVGINTGASLEGTLSIRSHGSRGSEDLGDGLERRADLFDGRRASSSSSLLSSRYASWPTASSAARFVGGNSPGSEPRRPAPSLTPSEASCAGAGLGRRSVVLFFFVSGTMNSSSLSSRASRAVIAEEGMGLGGAATGTRGLTGGALAFALLVPGWSSLSSSNPVAKGSRPRLRSTPTLSPLKCFCIFSAAAIDVSYRRRGEEHGKADYPNRADVGCNVVWYKLLAGRSGNRQLSFKCGS